jgi:hypothetical protein
MVSLIQLDERKYIKYQQKNWIFDICKILRLTHQFSNRTVQTVRFPLSQGTGTGPSTVSYQHIQLVLCLPKGYPPPNIGTNRTCCTVHSYLTVKKNNKLPVSPDHLEHRKQDPAGSSPTLIHTLSSSNPELKRCLTSFTFFVQAKIIPNSSRDCKLSQTLDYVPYGKTSTSLLEFQN